jgi:hypothetical protein
VKVCDICGDAGREDLLAICCRCTDGAEHTYVLETFTIFLIPIILLISFRKTSFTIIVSFNQLLHARNA